MKMIVGLHGEKMSMKTGVLIIKNGHFYSLREIANFYCGTVTLKLIEKESHCNAISTFITCLYFSFALIRSNSSHCELMELFKSKKRFQGKY